MLNAEPPTVPRKTGARLNNDDATLVRRIQAGDERAFAAIFERHHPPLLSYCRHMLGNRDDGEDALQQAFIRAHRAMLGGTTPRGLRPWLYAIARNCCLSAIAARRPTATLEDGTPALAGLSDEVCRREDLRELLGGIGRLPEDQRSALLLAELDDLSHQQIATVVGCPVNKVKALIYQARSALIAERDARDTPCQDIREQLAVARGGELRRGPLRRHLSLCASCRDFQLAVGTQRQSLACVLPVVPSGGLIAAIVAHTGAHAAGAASVGVGAGPAGGAAGGASAGATAAGPIAAGGTGAGVGAGGAGGIAATGTATTGAAAAGGAGGGTGVVTLLGSGVATKLAVGGVVVALAAASTAAVGQRPRRAPSRRVSHARLASFAASESGVGNGGGSGDVAAGAPSNGSGLNYGASTVSGEDLVVALTRETSSAGSTTGITGASVFAGPTGAAGAPALQMVAMGSPSSTVAGSAGVSDLQSGRGSVSQTTLLKTRKARAKLRREALRVRARKLREDRRRARLRNARRKALRRKRVAAKHPKPERPQVIVAAPLPAHPRLRKVHSTSIVPRTTTEATAGESENTPAGAPGDARHRHSTSTGTGSASTKTAGTTSEVDTTKSAKPGSATATGKDGSGAATGSSGSTGGSGSGAGKSGTGETGSGGGAEKTGSTSGKSQGGSATGGEGSPSAKNGEGGSGSGARSGSSAGKPSSETGTSEQDTSEVEEGGKTGESSKRSHTPTGAAGKGASSSSKKHLLEEEQLPNL